MNVEQIVELIQAVSASSIGELNYEEGNLKISLKKEENKTVLTSGEPLFLIDFSWFSPLFSHFHIPSIFYQIFYQIARLLM